MIHFRGCTDSSGKRSTHDVGTSSLLYLMLRLDSYGRRRGRASRFAEAGSTLPLSSFLIVRLFCITLPVNARYMRTSHILRRFVDVPGPLALCAQPAEP